MSHDTKVNGTQSQHAGMFFVARERRDQGAAAEMKSMGLSMRSGGVFDAHV